MTKIVVTSSKPLEIGSLHHFLHRDNRAKPRHQSFVVVAESTREEWVECVVAFGWDRGLAELFSDYPSDQHFYEIQTD